MSKSRTITLTDRQPIKIEEADWPVVAQSDWEHTEGGEFIKAQLRVRRHVDGRTIVYGTYHYEEDWTDRDEVWRAGALLDPNEDAVAAIHRVGKRLHNYGRDRKMSQKPDWLKLEDECIALLPAVAI